MGNFCKKICCKDLSKIPQSGHTEPNLENTFDVQSMLHYDMYYLLKHPSIMENFSKVWAQVKE